MKTIPSMFKKIIISEIYYFFNLIKPQNLLPYSSWKSLKYKKQKANQLILQ